MTAKVEVQFLQSPGQNVLRKLCVCVCVRGINRGH